MSNMQEAELKIWRYSQAPASLRKIAPAASEWVALIPRDLVCPETEALFGRWDTETRPIRRYVLKDGSVVMAGVTGLERLPPEPRQGTDQADAV
jgi:hypothetical protein